MDWIKRNKIKSVFLVVLVIFLGWFLLHEKQADLIYRVTGEELLRIKQECKELADAKLTEWNNSGLAWHTLQNYGYSEYRGFCYASYIRNFDTQDEPNEFIVLYNTTEEKEMTIRAWPDDLSWYEYDFDRMVLGKSRRIDFRAPW